MKNCIDGSMNIMQVSTHIEQSCYPSRRQFCLNFADAMRQIQRRLSTLHEGDDVLGP